MGEGLRVELPGGLHPRDCVWCDLSGVEGKIGESLLHFQDQGCAGFGRCWECVSWRFGMGNDGSRVIQDRWELHWCVKNTPGLDF